MPGGAAYAFETEVGPGSKYRMPTHDFAASTELRLVLDRCFAAHQVDRPELAGAFARAAEVLLRSAFPEIGDDIGRAASRKGRGDAIGARLVQHLDAASAACVALVLTLRGARRPVVDAITRAFQHEPAFNDTIRILCRRAFELAPTPISKCRSRPAAASIEVGAPSQR